MITVMLPLFHWHIGDHIRTDFIWEGKFSSLELWIIETVKRLRIEKMLLFNNIKKRKGTLVLEDGER